MNDIFSDVDRWLEEGQEVAIATVIKTWGSAPRPAGAKMALTAGKAISGSVSGGCVEGAVVDAGLNVLLSGEPELLHFGVADEEAWEVGLACGGNIDVFVQPLNINIYKELRRLTNREDLVARVSVFRGPAAVLGREILVSPSGRVHGVLPDELTKAATEIAMAELENDASRPIATRHSVELVDRMAEVELLAEIFPPPPVLIIVGGVHIAVSLTSLANDLGYHTIVVDPRSAFGSTARFQHADLLMSVWPQEAFSDIVINSSTALAMLTHDPKIDDPALHAALESEAFYIGALGSNRTQEKRRRRLQGAGYTEAQLSRIHGPIGLALGGRNPEEIAIAIMAQIVAARNRAL